MNATSEWTAWWSNLLRFLSQRKVARDQKVDALLADADWAVIRAWEHEDPAGVADRVELAVRAALREK
jgi:G:T-mismatch repair DNA endonuclease (very short patch repair protein)